MRHSAAVLKESQMSKTDVTDKRGNPMNEHNQREHQAKLERIAQKKADKAAAKQAKETVGGEKVAKSTGGKTRIAKQAKPAKQTQATGDPVEATRAADAQPVETAS
jgi:hypothetical protein